MNTQETVAEVQRRCLASVGAYHNKPKTRPVFSWPLDDLSGESWHYTIHCNVVVAWNKEGRQTECLDFYRKWLRSLDNIRAALENGPPPIRIP